MIDIKSRATYQGFSRWIGHFDIRHQRMPKRYLTSSHDIRTVH